MYNEHNNLEAYDRVPNVYPILGLIVWRFYAISDTTFIREITTEGLVYDSKRVANYGRLNVSCLPCVDVLPLPCVLGVLSLSLPMFPWCYCSLLEPEPASLLVLIQVYGAYRLVVFYLHHFLCTPTFSPLSDCPSSAHCPHCLSVVASSTLTVQLITASHLLSLPPESRSSTRAQLICPIFFILLNARLSLVSHYSQYSSLRPNTEWGTNTEISDIADVSVCSPKTQRTSPKARWLAVQPARKSVVNVNKSNNVQKPALLGPMSLVEEL